MPEIPYPTEVKLRSKVPPMPWELECLENGIKIPSDNNKIIPFKDDDQYDRFPME